MSQSTDGQICFGIKLDEDTELPWEDEDNLGGGGLEEWWRVKINGYVPSRELFTEEGDYIGGIKPSEVEIKAYFNEQHAFDEAHPLPIELVNYCSGDYPMYIIAVPRTCLSASRGEAELFAPEMLTVTDEEKTLVVSFCRDRGIVYVGEPQWWLSSYWG